MQFATTFPIFLRAVAGASAGSLEAELRLAVDHGIPVIRHVAERWRVKPVVLRHLVGKPPTLVGTQWESNVRGLAKILDMLYPEDLPGSDAQAWRALNLTAGVAERIFRRRPWASALGAAWVRDAFHRLAANPGDAGHDFVSDAVALDQAERLRDALISVLREVSPATDVDGDVARTHAAESIADRFILGTPIRRLQRLAETFARHVLQARTELAAETRLLKGTSFWPLLPEDFIGAGGRRRVKSLDTREALECHGSRLEICLGSSHLGSYADRCATGGKLHRRTVACYERNATVDGPAYLSEGR